VIRKQAAGEMGRASDLGCDYARMVGVVGEKVSGKMSVIEILTHLKEKKRKKYLLCDMKLTMRTVKSRLYDRIYIVS